MFRILNSQSKTITSAAFILAVAAIISRFLGFARNSLLANYFGAGDVVDAYYASFQIPDFIFNTIVIGALSAGFIPIFTQYIHKDNDEAWKFANNLLNILTIFLGGISLILFFAAPWVVRLIVPGFSDEKLELAISLSRIMFLQPIFLGLSAVFGGILQSFKKFFIYSLAPLFYNAGIIFGIIVLTPLFGLSGLAWGVVLGAFLHWIIQVPATFSSGFRYKFIFDFGSRGIKNIAVLMAPRTLSLIVLQINFLVVAIIASTLEEGSLAVFNFANDIQYLPIGIFAISLAIAAFPDLSYLKEREENGEFIAFFAKIVRKILFFLIPFSFLIFILRAQIVRIVLGYGRFDWNDTIATIDALAFFAFGIVAQGLVPLLVRVFFALHNTKIPLVAGAIAVFSNIILAVFFSGLWGVGGLALAFSISAWIEVFIFGIMLKIKLGNIGGKSILRGAVSFASASICAAVVSYFSLRLVAIFIDTHTVAGIFTQGAAAGVAGLIVYAMFALLFKCEEMYVIKELILNKTIRMLKF
ncbi:MAG: murein biosynthesis integral membrane protein MurJ [Patescibacteria group bacterium]